MTNVLLALENLSIGYGGADVISGYSLSIKCGEVFALIGPNGAGKTTLLKAIAGEIQPRAGSVRFSGIDVTSHSIHSRYQAGIAYVPEGGLAFPNLTVKEHYELGARDLQREEGKLAIQGVEAIIPALVGKSDQRAGSLSGGERQLLSLALNFIRKPKLVLIDEPTHGLSQKSIYVVATLIENLISEHISVIYAEQFPILSNTLKANVNSIKISVAHASD